MKHFADWIAKGAFACLVMISSYAALQSSVAAQPPQLPMPSARENEILHDRVTVLGDRLANIEGKLDVMEKLDIGLIVAMGGQLLHMALAVKMANRKRGGQ